MGTRIDPMVCNHCGTINPLVYFKPVLGTCVCYNCADKRKWLNKDGDLLPRIQL